MEQRRAIAMIVAAVALAVAVLAIVAAQPQQANAEPNETVCALAAQVDAYATAKLGAVDVEREQDAARAANAAIMAQRAEEARIAAEEAAQAAWEAEQAALAEQARYEAQYVDYAPSYGGIYYAEYSDAYNTDGPSRTMPGWYDGYLETYYSSNVLYHYQTPEWSVDDEGFYRTDEGYYVVGVDINDVNPETGEGYQIGDVIDVGRGQGIVMDYGSGAHVHDYYTNW